MNLGEKNDTKEFKKYSSNTIYHFITQACSTAKKSGDIEGDVYRKRNSRILSIGSSREYFLQQINLL